MSESNLFLLVTFAIFGVLACSTEPPVKEFSNDADAGIEISRLDIEIRQAEMHQINVLSPYNFAMATESLARAKEGQQRGDSEKTVLHELAVGQSYLNDADSSSRLSQQLLPQAAQKRLLAIAAGAPRYFPQQFGTADDRLRSTSRAVELNDTRAAALNQSTLEEQYDDLELNSIREFNLGLAKAKIAEAEREGAQELVPQALARAKAQVSLADQAIVQNRHDESTVSSASMIGSEAADRLLRRVRQAKNLAQPTLEDSVNRPDTDRKEKRAMGY